MIKTLASIEGLGEVVEVFGDFHSELQALKEAKARLISPRDEAYARIKIAGKERTLKLKDYYNLHAPGTRTTSGLEYIRSGELPILRLESRLLNPRLLKHALETKGTEGYFHTKTIREYKESLEQAKEDKNKEPEERNVIVLPSRYNFSITPTENWEVLQTILKDQAEEYFNLHKEITERSFIDVCLVNQNRVDSQNGTLLTNLWFGGLKRWSVLLGDSYLYGQDRARGVRVKSA